MLYYNQRYLIFRLPKHPSFNPVVVQAMRAVGGLLIFFREGRRDGGREGRWEGTPHIISFPGILFLTYAYLL